MESIVVRGIVVKRFAVRSFAAESFVVERNFSAEILIQNDFVKIGVFDSGDCFNLCPPGIL